MNQLQPPLDLSCAGSFPVRANLNGKSHTVYSRYFRNSELLLSLRPVHLASDLPHIFNWGYGNRTNASLVAASYLYTQGSSFARSYMVFQDAETALVQVDFSKARLDECAGSFPALPGDYIVRLLQNNQDNLPADILRKSILLCLEYFFQSPEVTRIVFEVGEFDNDLKNILCKSGFSLISYVYHRHHCNRLYGCTRSYSRYSLER